MKGIKHLIQCHCVLPQYRKMNDPVFHKFMAFSVIDHSDTVQIKYANCNNCGATHKIYDICQSEIMIGKENANLASKIEDFKLSLPQSLYETMKQYNKDIADFEQAQFIIDNEMWDSSIVLTREEIEDSIQGKLIKFIGKEKFRIESYSHQYYF